MELLIDITCIIGVFKTHTGCVRLSISCLSTCGADIGDKLIGPHIIECNLNGEKYQDFLDNELPQLLEDVSLGVRQNMWFQHDGCPAHYSAVAREVLDRDFHGRWIVRGGPIKWLARSSDLTNAKLFFVGISERQIVPTSANNSRGYN
ncbi:DDE 3 domain containing protein [Asbolus verrucosus]|uniref:DDE 3 domain containing protein n=1 Tax=Asbolus verrucosus TaxID=1661398 RepID=A0A482WD33_ASBVE|nr:DDE 3 domain containing protein [Asbolus verrucosus]